MHECLNIGQVFDAFNYPVGNAPLLLTIEQATNQ